VRGLHAQKRYTKRAYLLTLPNCGASCAAASAYRFLGGDADLALPTDAEG